MKFCQCASDGYCERYGRDMGGRMREICRGINVDLGTAAAFREEWSRRSGLAQPASRTVPLLLRTDQAPGDAVAMTAAIYSLHRAHPGRYLTAVASPYPEVFQHNPDVVDATVLEDPAEVRMHYPTIHRSNYRAVHFMQGWCEFLGMALGVSVPLLVDAPKLYFDAEEATSVEDYWVVCAGGKTDFTCKLWGHHNYQNVVEQLWGRVNFIQVGSTPAQHPRLYNTYDMVGKTTLRQLFSLVRRSRGVLCGVSLLMHVAAALGKPAVVVAGGREPVPWNAYPRQRYVHTVGALPCSDTQGHVGGACWRSRVQALGDDTGLDKDLCQRPVNGTPALLTKVVVPECMKMIHPDEVAGTVLMYNEQYGRTGGPAQ